MLGFGAGSILLGRLIDARGAFVTMLLATALIAGGYALAALAPNLWVFAAIQGVLIGTGSAATFIPLVADTSHWFAKRRGARHGDLRLGQLSRRRAVAQAHRGAGAPLRLAHHLPGGRR